MTPVKVHCIQYPDDFAEIGVDEAGAYLDTVEAGGDGRETTIMLGEEELVVLADAARDALAELLLRRRSAEQLEALTDPAPVAEAEEDTPKFSVQTVPPGGVQIVFNVSGDVHL